MTVLAAVFAALALAVLPTAAVAAPPLADGDSVYVGSQYYISGSAIVFPVWDQTPADLANPGEPDYWAYCIEQTVSAQFDRLGTTGTLSSFLGSNEFTDSVAQSKVLWVLANSYPALSVAELGAAAGVADLTLDEAISGTTTAIWRFSEMTFDAPYFWINDNAEAVYWHLIAGAHANPTTTPADLAKTVTITSPSGTHVAGTLVGPFVVNTDQPTASVVVDPVIPLTDAAGDPVDATAVVDGQQLYLDLRGVSSPGTATMTAAIQGSGATGRIISIPTVPGGTPTAADHAQSLILVAASTATTEVHADVLWTTASGEQQTDTLAEAGDASVLPLSLISVGALGAGALLLMLARQKHPRRA